MRYIVAIIVLLSLLASSCSTSDAPILSVGSGSYSSLIDAGATTGICSGGKNNSDCYDEIVNKQFANGNTTKIFNGLLSVPWYQSSTSCTVPLLQNGSNCNIGHTPTNTEYCIVSDEHSVVCENVAHGSNETRMDAMYNSVLAMRTNYGSIPGWRCVGNETGGYINCSRTNVNSNGDTASDATWRYIDCFYVASTNTAFSTGNRSKYEVLANNLSRDSYSYEFTNVCYNSTLGSGEICHIAGGGAAVTSCGITCTDRMYSGYLQDGAKAFNKACVRTGNGTYCAVAGNLTLQYLQAANYTGSGFVVPPGKSWRWNTTTVGSLTNVLVAQCTNTCSPDQWDSTDAVRAFAWGEAAYEANLSGHALPNISGYLSYWNSLYLIWNNNSVPIQYYKNGTPSASNQSGYFAQGLQSQAVMFANPSNYKRVLNNSLGHYSSGTGTWDSTACFGVYQQGPVMRSYAVGIGRSLNALEPLVTNTAFSGAINATVNSPVNASTITQNSVYFNITLWNNNVSSSLVGAVWSVIDVDTFSSSSENWTGGTRDSTAGTYNVSAGATGRKNWNQSIVSVGLQNCTVANMTIGNFTYVDGANDPKVFVPGETASDNDYLLFDGTQPTIDWKHVDDGGGFSTCNLDISGSFTWSNSSTLSILRNLSSGSWTTYYGGSRCRTESSTLTNGTNFEINANSGAFSFDSVIYSCYGDGTLTSNNASMNVSLSYANGTVFYSVNNVQNASDVAYNLTNITNGNYSWFLTVRTVDSIANYSGLSFVVNAPPPDVTPPSFTFVFWNITNQTMIMNTTASEPANLTVRYGESPTTLNYIPQKNTTVAINLTLFLYTYEPNTTFYFNITRCDISGNCNTTGPHNATTLPSPIVSVSRCPYILNYAWVTNISRGKYDPKTKTYNESSVRLVNNSLCGWTYKLRNDENWSATFNITTNYTNSDGNLTLFVNGTMINASSQYSITIPGNTTIYLNVTMNLTRWPILQTEPSINISGSRVG